MKYPTLCLMFLYVLCSNSLNAQDSLSTDYPFLYKVRLDARVNLDSAMYFYSHTLVNDAANKGDVSSFQLNIAKPPNSIQYDTVGLLFSGKGLLEKWFRRKFPAKAYAIVPVGYPRLPRFWLADLGSGPLLWLSVDTNEVKPGERLSGFQLMSKGLPGIRSFKAEPLFDIYKFFPNLEDTSRTMTISQMDSIREVVNYWGWTVGPTAPPRDFKATEWCDTLVSYTTQCRSLGWIKDQATSDKYLGYFSSAKTSLQQNNIWSARGTLQRVLQDANADSTSNLTSEAYGLIRYNTQYLLTQLR